MQGETCPARGTVSTSATSQMQSFYLCNAACDLSASRIIRYGNTTDNYFIGVRRRTVYRNTRTLYYGRHSILSIPKYEHNVSIHIKLTVALLGKSNANLFVCAHSSILFTGLITTQTQVGTPGVSKFVRLINTFLRVISNMFYCPNIGI
jgi:hypothetical protein